MGINLLTFNQKTVAPKDDALIQQYALGQDGFFYGGTPTYTGGNTIHFQSGEGMMCGREFVLEDTDVSAALPASGTLLGQVYIHIDLSNTDNPIELICETAETLTELTKDENLNVNNGTYDLQLCTFTANVSNITDLVSQIKQIKKGGGGSDENLAQIEDGTEATRAYVAGEFVVVDGLLRKVLAPIAIGDEFEDDVNEEITNVGAQITALNQNLTKCLTYNEDTDFYGAVNPNTHQWVNLLYAGFNRQDIIQYIADGEIYAQDSKSGSTPNAGLSFTHSNGVISFANTGFASYGGNYNNSFSRFCTHGINVNRNSIMHLTVKAKAQASADGQSLSIRISSTPNASGDIASIQSIAIDNTVHEYSLNLYDALVAKGVTDFTRPYYVYFYDYSSKISYTGSIVSGTITEWYVE